jgi:hypothetical protein
MRKLEPCLVVDRIRFGVVPQLGGHRVQRVGVVAAGRGEAAAVTVVHPRLVIDDQDARSVDGGVSDQGGSSHSMPWRDVVARHGSPEVSRRGY